MLGSFESADAAIEGVDLAEVDLIFLDIEMPGMSGLDLLKVFKHLPAVVVISAKDKYAIEAFDFEVAIIFLTCPPLEIFEVGNSGQRKI